MKTRSVSGLCLGLALVLVGQAVLASQVVRDPLPAQKFLAKVISSGIAEVKLSEEAAKIATNADVKQFAQMMVNGHRKVNDRLLDLAKDMKVAVGQGLDKSFQKRLDELTRQKGAAFDREYMKHQVKAHEQAIAMFQAQAKGATNEQVKAFAEKALPALRMHLEEARRVYDKVK